MNLTLWIIAGLLAAAFLTGGVIKVTQPKEKLATAPGGGWVEDFSPNAVRAIGVLEILAAVGLVLPAAVGVAPVLVPLAAVGLVLMMAGAIITHLRRHETKAIMVNLAYIAVAAFVVWGRFGPESFTS